jgi:hypothetical protein
MDQHEAARRLAVLNADSVSVVKGVRLRTDDDLNALVADVLWVVPAPAAGERWRTRDLDALCERAVQALGDSVAAVYCRYRTPLEVEMTAESDNLYFLRVAA